MHSWHTGPTAPEAVARLRLYLRGLLGERSAGPALVRRAQLTPLDANYRHAGLSVALGSSQALSTVVHAGGCASLLLCILLYGLDAMCQDSSVTFPAGTALTTGVGLFLLK